MRSRSIEPSHERAPFSELLGMLQEIDENFVQRLGRVVLVAQETSGAAKYAVAMSSVRIFDFLGTKSWHRS